MKGGTNRRLANIKTRKETGLDYVISQLDINTPYGKKAVKELKPYFPGEEKELCQDLDRIETTMDFIKECEPQKDMILQAFMEMKESTLTIERSETAILSVVELYDIKVLLLLMSKIQKAFAEAKVKLPKEFALKDTENLLNELDPRKDRMPTFYVYNEFSDKLASLRDDKHKLEVEARKEQKVIREKIRKEHGIVLTPKFDIALTKTSDDYKKAITIPELELVSEDYMSATFELKKTDKVYDLVQKMEALNTELEEEEEKVRKKLSRTIAGFRDILLENCNKIGQLDLTLAKADYAIRHNCVKPQIVDEHIVSIEEGRNLEVEDILKSKGKEYCPVSITLEDGVTCITGANMGGKTISLKLSGLVPILAQYAFFVPAKSAKVGLSNYMQMLIGDSQSVERGLSSFGSEMEELKEILDHGQDRSMILIDEIASGTNPVEGLALTRSLIDYLKPKSYITLITTHFDAATEGSGVKNMQVRGLAGVDFVKLNTEISRANRKERIDIISKYMDYRLYAVENQKQVPKDALNIAKMLGINREIIEGAKKYIK